MMLTASGGFAEDLLDFGTFRLQTGSHAQIWWMRNNGGERADKARAATDAGSGNERVRQTSYVALVTGGMFWLKREDGINEAILSFAFSTVCRRK